MAVVTTKDNLSKLFIMRGVAGSGRLVRKNGGRWEIFLHNREFGPHNRWEVIF